jgi:adenylate cyclase
MSGDPEQEYFSDGVTEDIITDLSKVSALEVVSRNGSFLYKGKQIDVPKVAHELKVTHVLEGSVRRAGGRVRITAQLIDGESDRHLWAERYDRDASDIFELQDEISHAIVKALRLRLLPEEKKAIERRGTDSVEAHDLYLMARQIYVTSREDERASQAIVRTCKRATEVDPKYAQAWALMAMGYRNLRELGVQSDDGMAAAERALSLDQDLAEAHAVKAYILQMKGAMDEAIAEVAIALELDPESYEANRTAGRLNYQLHRFEDAARLFEKSVSLMDSDVNSAMMLVSSHRALGNTAGMRHAAEVASRRADAVLARDQNNSGVMAYSAVALGALGEAERAKARMSRALLIDPDNWDMRYNFACTLNEYMHDKTATLDMLAPLFATISDYLLRYLKTDPDLESLHDDPRYIEMVAAAEARLAAAKDSAPRESTQPA